VTYSQGYERFVASALTTVTVHTPEASGLMERPAMVPTGVLSKVDEVAVKTWT
jgi:hypothetical protein